MALPHDNEIKRELLNLLNNSPNGTLMAQDAYKKLEEKFPKLTWEEKKAPYRRSRNKFANRVQFARLHLKEEGYIYGPNENGSPGRGYWKITEKGKDFLSSHHKIFIS